MTAPTSAGRPVRGRRKLPTWVLALIVFGLTLGALVAALYKPQLTTLGLQLTGAETREIHLPADQYLLYDASDVKVAGLDVGVVDKAERHPDGGAIVTVVVEDEVVHAVGDAPSARLRPNTLLGGKFYMDIVPGGDRTAEWTERIPVERTRMPVEVDDLAETLQPDALDGAKVAVTQFDATLEQGGADALKSLLATAPDTFRPATGVFEALRGTRPEVDLQNLVSNLQTTSAVLTREDGRLDAIVANLQDTSEVLADTSGPFAEAIDRLPAALDTADAGLVRLNGSLDRLENTAGPARASVQELDGLLERIEPVLADARPVVDDLRIAFQDTRPLVEDLVPASDGVANVMDDLRGPVLDRLNGPVNDAVYSPFKGTGPYRFTEDDTPFHEELGYMFTGLAKAGAYVDPNGHAVAFHPGGGLGTPEAVGEFSLEQMYQQMFHGSEGR